MIASDRDISSDRGAVPDLVPIHRAKPRCASFVESAEFGKKNSRLPTAVANLCSFVVRMGNRAGFLGPCTDWNPGCWRWKCYQNLTSQADLIFT